MRFEKVIWTLLAMWLSGGSVVWTSALSRGETGEYRALDGASKTPPPPPSGP